MTIETFFEKFDQFADALDAVARMRELVLTLAVQGKLVDQYPEDEPASKLLEQIEKQNGNTYQPINKESVPYQAPASWIWAKLGFLAEIERGGSPRPIKDYITDDPEGLNWIKIGDTEKGGRYITSTQEKIRKEGLKKTRRVYPGDFLLTNSMSFGRPYITKIEGCIHDGWLRIHPPRQITPEYLYHLLSSSSVYAFFCKSAAGAVVQNLNADKVRELPIPLPPLAEQKRIVAKVDELMALCDRLEAQQKDREEKKAVLARASLARFADAPTPANLNFLFHSSFIIHPSDLRKSILTLAVQGKLVTQDPNDEPAEALLERVASTAKTRRRGADELDDIEALFPIPETWEWVRLPRVLKKLTDGTHHSPPNGSSGAFMYVTAKNIKTDGVLLDGITYVSKEVHDEIYSRCDPTFGDVLYIKDGATTGIATINQVKEPFSMLSSVALLKPSEAIFNRYLLWAMRSPFFYEETRGSMKGAAITRVTLSVMAASLLPIPPLAEQRRIVAKVDQLMALVDELETQLAVSRAAAVNLLSAAIADLTGTSAKTDKTGKWA